MPNRTKTFRATLEPLKNNLGWTIARISFDVAQAWPVRNRLRVKGEINGFAFRTSLFAASGGTGHFLLVNKRMQSAAHAYVGMAADFKLEPDLEERAAAVPPELAEVLAEDKALRRWFERLNYSMRRDCGAWINGVKSPEARMRRAEQLAERLLLAMEGERELPPILRAAFQRQPLARNGWESMTPLQRRGHLLGIFYYKSPEARERRTAKAVEAALQAASVKTVGPGE